jgi:coproporphyrinogen III oxidase
MKNKIAQEFQLLQDRICRRLETLDGETTFHEDNWKREEGGGGRTRVISHGRVFEKGGVNFSEVHGPVTDLMKKQLQMDGNEFYATGVSIVLHPHHPFVPIMHMNVRYFQLDDTDYWFGGGIDMTPHYVNPEWAGLFHKGLKQVCDKYHPDFYEKFKVWADDYFFIPHRNETRGVGGIFYDHQKATETITKEDLLQFALDLGDVFAELYAGQYHLGSQLDFNEDHV